MSEGKTGSKGDRLKGRQAQRKTCSKGDRLKGRHVGSLNWTDVCPLNDSLSRNDDFDL